MIDFLLALPITLLSLKDYDFNDWDRDDRIVNSSSGMEIASDSSFANKTHEFNPSQTIYVRVTSQVSASTKKELNLRDNSYNLLNSYGFSQISTNPYKFTTSFSAPSVSGIYSLEARLESAGSVVNLVQTIEVNGNGSNNSSVSVNIDNQVNTGAGGNKGDEGNVLGEESEEISSSAEAAASAQQDEKENFWTTIWKNILEFFGGFF